MLLEGLHLPLLTPFYPDGRLNLRKLEHNVDRYSRTPVAGLVAMGEAGEPSLLSDAEMREALTVAMGAAAETKVMIAGVSRGSVIGTLELAEFAASLRYDAVLVKRPAELISNQVREVLTFFQAVADRSPLPVLLSSGGSTSLPVEVITELASHPRVLGLADEDLSAARMEAIRSATSAVRREVTVTHVFAAATGRMLEEREQPSGAAAGFVSAESLGGGGAAVATASVAAAPARPAVKTRSKTVGFQIVAASSVGMLSGLRSGAVGMIPGFAAAAPQACYEVYAAWKDDDQPLAEEKQARISAAIQRVELELGVPGLRYASDLTGYFGGRPRLPLLPVSGAERERIDSVMDGIRN
jgi:4-hydroxy-2-oxoglutarate aldolase